MERVKICISNPELIGHGIRIEIVSGNQTHFQGVKKDGTKFFKAVLQLEPNTGKEHW